MKLEQTCDLYQIYNSIDIWNHLQAQLHPIFYIKTQWVYIYNVIVHIGTYTVGIKNESTACNCMYILNPYNLYS